MRLLFALALLPRACGLLQQYLCDCEDCEAQLAPLREENDALKAQLAKQREYLLLALGEAPTGGACASCMHYDSCQGGCMAAKFFTGLPLDGPDPECVRGFGEQALAARDGSFEIPKSEVDHSRSKPRNSRGPVPVQIGMGRPDKACETSPLVDASADTRLSSAAARA